MEIVLKIAGIAALISGTGFSILGMLGLLRLPDSYTRLHATGKISVFGCVFLMISAIKSTPLTLGKGLVLIFLLLLCAPASAHAIASAAHRSGVPMQKSTVDDLIQRSRAKSPPKQPEYIPPD